VAKVLLNRLSWTPLWKWYEPCEFVNGRKEPTHYVRHKRNPRRFNISGVKRKTSTGKRLLPSTTPSPILHPPLTSRYGCNPQEVVSRTSFIRPSAHPPGRPFVYLLHCFLRSCHFFFSSSSSSSSFSSSFSYFLCFFFILFPWFESSASWSLSHRPFLTTIMIPTAGSISPGPVSDEIARKMCLSGTHLKESERKQNAGLLENATFPARFDRSIHWFQADGCWKARPTNQLQKWSYKINIHINTNQPSEKW